VGQGFTADPQVCLCARRYVPQVCACRRENNAWSLFYRHLATNTSKIRFLQLEHTAVKNDRKELSKAEFDRDALQYDQTSKYAPLRQSYQRIANEALERPFRAWLDIGCGTGSLLQMIRQLDTSAQLFGVDLSEEMIKVAQSKLGNNADLRVADSEELPFENEQFDLITCTFSFHHHPNPRRSLQEMRRVLAPAGRVIIADPSPFFPARQILNLIAPLSKDGTVRFYSRAEMQRMLADNGLAVSKWLKLNWHSFLMVAEEDQQRRQVNLY
jgi:ubiquinone/menaquinone biosynthesis C-methylase UbiE